MKVKPEMSVNEGAVDTHHTGYAIVKADLIRGASELAKGYPVSGKQRPSLRGKDIPGDVASSFPPRPPRANGSF